MSHVADGILHAYLDGALDALSDAGELPDGMKAADVKAHLATCADCRARLEAERSVRENAGIILGDASVPHVDLPAFTAVAGTRRGRRARWLPLGWAASVLLALGVGWWGSEVWRADRFAGVAVDQEAVQTPGRESPGQPRPERASTAAAPAQPAEPESQTLERGQQASAGSAASADASGAHEVREPIGAELGDAAAAGESRPNTALAGTIRSQDVTTTIPMSEARRSFATAPPPAVGRTLDAAVIEAQNARAIVDVREMAAFDSVIALERSGTLPFRAVASSGQHTIEDQLFIVTDASAPVVEAAREPERTTVRVRQTLSNGKRVEIVTWREHAVELSDLVATGRPTGRSDATVRSQAAAAQPEASARQESAARQTTAAGEAPQVISSTARRLEDGRRELVLRSSAGGGVWIALRAEMSEQELRALIRRLAKP